MISAKPEPMKTYSDSRITDMSYREAYAWLGLRLEKLLTDLPTSEKVIYNYSYVEFPQGDLDIYAYVYGVNLHADEVSAAHMGKILIECIEKFPDVSFTFLLSEDLVLGGEEESKYVTTVSRV